MPLGLPRPRVILSELKAEPDGQERRPEQRAPVPIPGRRWQSSAGG